VSFLIRPQAHRWWCCTVQSYSVGTADGSQSHLSGAYFEVFSSSSCFLFAIHGQLFSNSSTFFLCLSTTLASIRFVLTSVFSAYTGTSQKALARSFLYSGFGVSGEHQDGALSINPISQSRSKKRTLLLLILLLLLLLSPFVHLDSLQQLAKTITYWYISCNNFFQWISFIETQPSFATQIKELDSTLQGKASFLTRKLASQAISFDSNRKKGQTLNEQENLYSLQCRLTQWTINTFRWK